MGFNDRMPDLSGIAEAICEEAGAIKRCEWHEEITEDMMDSDANSKAYAIATNRHKRGEIDCTREELMDAIKDAIDSAGMGCPICEKQKRD